MTTPALPRETFVALAAVAWADGRMSKDEANGLLHTAQAHGLGGDDLATVGRATKEKVDLAAFDASGLSATQRLVTYALASWLSRIDGMQQGAEIDSLRALGKKLESADVTDFKLRSAAAAAFDVAMLPEGRRPDRFDFAALEKAISERFPTIKG
jgi:hypothetical protein